MTTRIMVAISLAAVCGLVLAQTEWDFGIGQKDQVTKGLVAYWAMRNSGTTVFDEWGAYNGTATNSVTFGETYAAVGYGASFDGSDEYVTCGDIDFTSALSISAWVKVLDNSLNKAIAYKGDPGSAASFSYGLFLEDTGNKVRFMLSANGTTLAYRTGAVSVNIAAGWTHVVAVYNGTTMLIYINTAQDDGTLTGTVPAALNNSAAALLIGRSTWNGSGGSYFDGNIDELRLYNRALTADEIKQLYRMGAIPKGIK